MTLADAIATAGIAYYNNDFAAARRVLNLAIPKLSPRSRNWVRGILDHEQAEAVFAITLQEWDLEKSK